MSKNEVKGAMKQGAVGYFCWTIYCIIGIVLQEACVLENKQGNFIYFNVNEKFVNFMPSREYFFIKTYL